MNEKSDQQPVAADQPQTLDASGKTNLFDTSLTLAELDLHGGVFWDEMTRCTDNERLEDLVDAVLSRQPSPRVWVFLDTPSNTSARSVAALIIARTLCRRGKKVLLLDGDDLRPDLTRWAGSFEKEGWIDYLRYGASLTACATPFPWEGGPGYFVGVGSFCPTQVTAEEVKQLMGRLRPQADDIVITAPLGDVGRQWAGEASVRLLCWDRQAHSRAASEATAAGLAAAGIQVAGLIGFGFSPDEMDSVTTAEPEIAEPARTSAEESAAELADRFVIVSREEKEGPRSSRLFWGFAALLAVLVVVIGVIWFRITQFKQPDSESAGTPAAVVADLGSTGPGATDAESSPVPDPTVTPARPTAADHGADVAATAPEPLNDTEAAAAVEPAVTEPTRPESAQSDTRAEASGTAAGATAFDLSAYQGPVGQAGWALHLYSLADSNAAMRQMEALDRLGIRSVERLVVLPEKGRWHRVYVGSFSSRQEAVAAKPVLLEKLGEDWAMPYSFR